MLLILGNQLFAAGHLPPADATPVFMAEDIGLCTYEKHHQQKIVLFLAAMRSYADELREAGYDVHYEQLDESDTRPFAEKLLAHMQSRQDSELQHFEIEDKVMSVVSEQMGINKAEITRETSFINDLNGPPSLP